MNLLALLSLPLVALTIEIDNEYEHRIVHRTTLCLSGDSPRGPWLTSFAMYANCLQFLGEAPITVQDLDLRARARTNLDGMRRWGYVKLTPPAERPASKVPSERWLIEATSIGRVSQEVWRPLPPLIEQRWRDRFGANALRSLREALLNVNQEVKVAYPDFLPILGYGLFTRGKGPGALREMPPLSDAPLDTEAPLTALLSRLLCAFAYDFERDSPLSLAISANLLNVFDDFAIRYQDLPQLAGISKESIAMAMGILKKANLVEIGIGAGKLVRLTKHGVQAQHQALDRIAYVEERWVQELGGTLLKRLRDALKQIVGEPADRSSLLLQGLQPYPDNWRASKPRLETLPQFPMVLHRGGYPDGS